MTALFPWFDELVKRAAYDLPWCVVSEAPETLEGLTTVYRQTGRICVSGQFSDRTIFGAPVINHAFRAWHDWHHVRLQATFDREGEATTMAAQYGDCLRLLPSTLWRPAWRVLECEIIGQFDYQAFTGQFPCDQRAFALGYFRQRDWSI